MNDFLKRFEDYVEVMADDEEGFRMSPGMSRKGEQLTMMTMAMDPREVDGVMLDHMVVETPDEAIWAIDRFGKEGQGTTRANLLAGYYYVGDTHKIQPFILEYDLTPEKVFEPLNLDPPKFWKDVLKKELLHSLGQIMAGVRVTGVSAVEVVP